MKTYYGIEGLEKIENGVYNYNGTEIRRLENTSKKPIYYVWTKEVNQWFETMGYLDTRSMKKDHIKVVNGKTLKAVCSRIGK